MRANPVYNFSVFGEIEKSLNGQNCFEYIKSNTGINSLIESLGGGGYLTWLGHSTTSQPTSIKCS